MPTIVAVIRELQSPSGDAIQIVLSRPGDDLLSVLSCGVSKTAAWHISLEGLVPTAIGVFAPGYGSVRHLLGGLVDLCSEAPGRKVCPVKLIRARVAHRIPV
jgi:hypothetical protein